MTLQEHSPAPDFSLPDKDNKIHTLSKIKSEYLVLYFYPKDNTQGCTIEATDFTRLQNDLKKVGAEIIGISGGNNITKAKFCEQHNLKILLLSDEDFAVCKKYGVYGEKRFMGKKFFGIKRTTFIIKNKKIIKVYENVSAAGHGPQVLDFLESK